MAFPEGNISSDACAADEGVDANVAIAFLDVSAAR